MTNPIIRGFRSLTRFSGRDRRSQFWPYAGVAVALTFVAMGAAMVWVMSSFWAEAMQIAQAHPETVTVESGPGYYSRSVDVSDYGLMPDFTAFFTVMGVSVVAYIALLAAAVSRRIHDLGKSAFWGLMPVPFLLFGVGVFPIMMNDMMQSPEPNLALFFLLFFNNMAYIIGLISLIVMLCLKGTSGPNRFGAEVA
jgi:uncharacterized membrane protein YhaH (DUF805 family)